MKKKSLFLKNLLVISAGFLLASCDPVHTLPSKHTEEIVINADQSSLGIDDNTLLEIYNLVQSGQNEEAVSSILRKIAEKKFGTYKEFYDASHAIDDSVRDAYLSAHSEYFGTDDRVDRFNEFVKDIESRISEAFYNEITSGSYNDVDGKFSEAKLYNAKRYELYDFVDMPAEVAANKFFVTSELTKENVFSGEGSSHKLLGQYFNLAEGKRGYIEEKVFPEIIKNKLVESYIYSNNDSSLGRAYARKINYIKVSYEDEFADLWKLLKKFADLHIEQAGSKMNFELITSAVKGFSKFSDAQMVDVVYGAASGDAQLVDALLSSVYGTPALNEENFIKVDGTDPVEWAKHYKYDDATVLVPAGFYYKDTKLGQILKSYEDAIAAEKAGRFATEAQKAELEKFTGEGKSKQYGLMQKLISLAKEDYTTDGWVLKNGGATELPSSIRDRLFNIQVANILDDNEGENARLPQESTLGDYEADSQKAKNYLRNIYGHKLMLSSEASTFANEHYNYIHQDVDGKAFYICEVLEAPSTAKFNDSSSSVYKKADGSVDSLRIEHLKRYIAKVLGTKDSYIKDAYTEELNKFTDYNFYDSSLYDYLKSEYPDMTIFDED